MVGLDSSPWRVMTTRQAAVFAWHGMAGYGTLRGTDDVTFAARPAWRAELDHWAAAFNPKTEIQLASQHCIALPSSGSLQTSTARSTMRASCQRLFT